MAPCKSDFFYYLVYYLEARKASQLQAR